MCTIAFVQRGAAPTHSFKTGAKQGLFWERFDPVVVEGLTLPFTRKKPETGYVLKLL